jgi:peptidoglycan/xylan/chitin deacetylase (PgdA/CDA1 family)
MEEAIQTALAAVAVAAPAIYFSPWLWRRYRMSHTQEQVVTKRMLALTYDDGPSMALTQPLLDLLHRSAARASFFMLGRHARQYSGIADRVLQEGHDIGCHSDQHLNAWKTLPWKSVADIDAGYSSLSRWVQPDGMFRPPYGKMTLPTYWSLRRRNAPVWWWTIDSGDTQKVLPNPRQVAYQVRRAGGGIVLMHDLDRTQERNQYVLEVTASLLEVARQEAIKVVPLRELCQ